MEMITCPDILHCLNPMTVLHKMDFENRIILIDLWKTTNESIMKLNYTNLVDGSGEFVSGWKKMP